MYVKILPLILAIAFYQLDIGVDIKVAKEQYHLTFGEAQNITTRDQASSLFNGSIFILDSEWQETKNWYGSFRTKRHSVTQQVYEYTQMHDKRLDYELIHLILTATWLVLGGLCQSSLILINIRTQTYIPFIWQIAITISSLFLMGPTFIYFFSIFTILTSKASILEKKRIILMASEFAALSKLGELFLESFPQYISQFLMVSAKGSAEGFREFSEPQQLSVITSAISVSLSIATFMVHRRKTNPFVPNQYHSLASFVSIIIFIASEIAFFAGVGRFTLAPDLTYHKLHEHSRHRSDMWVHPNQARVPIIENGLLFAKFHLLYFLPFLCFSTNTIFLVLLFPCRHFNKHGRLALFLLIKLFLILSFITFWCLDTYDVSNKYLTPHEVLNYTILPTNNQLEKNNSYTTFYLTLTVAFPINILLGFIFFFYENSLGAKVLHPVFTKGLFPFSKKIATILKASRYEKIVGFGETILTEIEEVEEDEDQGEVIQREAEALLTKEATQKKQATETTTATFAVRGEAEESLIHIELQSRNIIENKTVATGLLLTAATSTITTPSLPPTITPSSPPIATKTNPPSLPVPTKPNSSALPTTKPATNRKTTVTTVAAVTKSLLGIVVAIIFTIVPLYVIVKSSSRGKEFVLKLDGLKDISETSYGFGNDTRGFPLLARYEDSRYGAVCTNENLTENVLQKIVCSELNITDRTQFGIFAKPIQKTRDPVIKVDQCKGEEPINKDIMSCNHKGFGIVDPDCTRRIFVDCNTGITPPPFIATHDVGQSRFRITAVKVRGPNCGWTDDFEGFCKKYGSEVALIDSKEKYETLYKTIKKTNELSVSGSYLFLDEKVWCYEARQLEKYSMNHEQQEKNFFAAKLAKEPGMKQTSCSNSFNTMMDSNGILKYRGPSDDDDFHMCVCENLFCPDASYMPIKDSNHGKFVLKLDRLGSKCSYGFGGDSHLINSLEAGYGFGKVSRGFLLFVSYKDHRYEILCTKDDSKIDLTHVICRQLNTGFTDTPWNPVIEISYCKGDKDSTNYGFDNVDPDCGRLLVNWDETVQPTPFIATRNVEQTRFRITGVKLRAQDCHLFCDAYAGGYLTRLNGYVAIIDAEEKYKTAYEMTQKTNEEQTVREAYVIGLIQLGRDDPWTSWDRSSRKEIDENFFSGRWAKGEPNRKTEDGGEIPYGAVAVMDADGKLRDEDYWADNQRMCICENMCIIDTMDFCK